MRCCFFMRIWHLNIVVHNVVDNFSGLIFAMKEFWLLHPEFRVMLSVIKDLYFVNLILTGDKAENSDPQLKGPCSCCFQYSCFDPLGLRTHPRHPCLTPWPCIPGPGHRWIAYLAPWKHDCILSQRLAPRSLHTLPLVFWIYVNSHLIQHANDFSTKITPPMFLC